MTPAGEAPRRQEESGFTRGLFIILTAGMVVLSPLARAQTVVLEDQIVAPADTAAGQHFGLDVAVAGEWGVVGAPYDAELGPEAGAAYVLHWVPGTGWTQHTKLLSSDGAAGDQFGFSVDIDNDTIVVGSWNDVENGIRSGSATVFTRVGADWVEAGQLIPSDGEVSDRFGWAVAVEDDSIAIGAIGVDLQTFGLAHGAVYPYRKIGAQWVEEPRLTSVSPSTSSNLGFTVSLSQGSIAVGTLASRIELFRQSPSGWLADSAILSPVSPSGGFGARVSLSGDRIVTGARLDDEAAQNAGAAFVYLYDGFSWIQEQKLMRATAQVNDFLGSDIFLDGDLAVVTAPASDSVAMVQGIGSASVFERQGGVWVETTRLVGSGFGMGEYTGAGAAASDRRVILGFFTDDLAGALSGSVYSYALDRPFERGDCDQDEFITISDAIFHLSALFIGGSPSPACADACDGNDDGFLNIADPLYVLTYLFLAGSPPPLPTPGTCDDDPTADVVGCATTSCP